MCKSECCALALALPLSCKSLETFSAKLHLIICLHCCLKFVTADNLMMNEIASDYRVRELLVALNEGVLDVEFVEAKLKELTGDRASLVHHSDGEYDIAVA